MTQHYFKRTFVIVAAMMLLISSPVMAKSNGTSDDGIHGKSWIADALRDGIGGDVTTDSVEVTGTEKLVVLDSNDVIVGTVGNMGSGFWTYVSLNLADGRNTALVVSKNYFMGVDLLYSESTDCSAPYYIVGRGHGPNDRMVDRSAVGPGNILYTEDMNGDYSPAINLASFWNPGSGGNCYSWGVTRKDAIPVFFSDDLSDLLPPFRVAE